MTTRPYLLILFAALLISGCGSAEYPGKGAPKASAKDDLSARALAKRDMDTDTVSASAEKQGLPQEIALPAADSVVSAVLQEGGAEQPLTNEDLLYIDADEPPADNGLTFLAPVNDWTEDVIEAKGAQTGPDPSVRETDCDYLSPGDPGYCQPAETAN